MPGKWGRKQKSVETEAQPDTHVSATIDHTVISSDIGKPKKTKKPKKPALQTVKAWSPKKQLVVGLLFVGLVVFVGVGAYMLLRNNDPDPTLKDVQKTSEGVVLRQIEKDNLQTEIEKLMHQKKYTSAIALIQYQEAAKKDKDIQILLATAYMNQSKHQEALNVFMDIQENFDKDWKVTRNIAVEYEALGDKTKALEYYKKALEQLKDTDNVPVKDDEILFLEKDIKRVGG